MVLEKLFSSTKFHSFPMDLFTYHLLEYVVNWFPSECKEKAKETFSNVFFIPSTVDLCCPMSLWWFLLHCTIHSGYLRFAYLLSDFSTFPFDGSKRSRYSSDVNPLYWPLFPPTTPLPFVCPLRWWCDSSLSSRDIAAKIRKGEDSQMSTLLLLRTIIRIVWQKFRIEEEPQQATTKQLSASSLSKIPLQHPVD